MLQVARLAPKQLGESRDLVAAFLLGRLNPDGGFQNRAGDSDLYYTVFGLEGLIALQEQIPGAVAGYLRQFGDGDGLDFVHVASLARCVSSVGAGFSRPEQLLARIETHRSADGGYAQSPNAAHGSVYAAFLALGAYEDCGATLPQPERLAESIARLRARDGGYANHPGDAQGITTVTAAAALVLRRLEAPIDRHVGMWLLDRCQAGGGFLATPNAPVPDLLSTATALHALSALHVPLGGVQEPCLDFVDSLWTNRGGFYGTWMDDDVDCEYTYYALLALGHLTLAPG
jgi:prenyltransferase beta subunit